MPRTRHRPTRPTLIAVGLVAASLLTAVPAFAQDTQDPRIDPTTGRDVSVWPPDRLFDHQHMLLKIDIPDMHEPKFTASDTLTLTPIGTARDFIKLRAGKGLTFTSITVNGVAVPKTETPASGPGFTHSDGILNIRFPKPITPGQRITLVMNYDGEKAGGGGAGLTWSKDDPRTPEEDFLFHSQGQPESNHLWFPCHDFPNERLTTELVVTAPKDYQVVSNGRLVEIKRFADGSGRRTFHWLQDKPHTYYLVVMVVGKFDVVNVGGPDSKRPGLWMPVYGPVGRGEAIRDIFGNTPEMVAYFEKLFDEPYPWDKYAQILVRDFAAGAMENTSATTFHPQFAQGRRGSADSVISHELCHQWFGDLAAYKSWQNLWLGEGWATMGEALWAEHQQGTDGYQQVILRDFGREGASRGYFPRSGGMISNRYTDPQQRFGGSDNVYSKGGFFLHMLRARLGDEAFFKGSALYLDRLHLACAETDDFRKCLEEVSGQSLERFFDQWARRPGHARIDVDLAWDDAKKTLNVVVEQTQKIDADNPAYAFTLPLYLDYGNDKGKYVYLNIDTTKTDASFNLDAKPDDVAIDPNLTVLASSKIRQPLSAWLNQLQRGPTLYARVQAADALSEFPDPEAVGALSGVATSAAASDALRQTASASLAAIGARHAAASLTRSIVALVNNLAPADRVSAATTPADHAPTTALRAGAGAIR
jgi:aminopeptidase N